GRGAGRLPGRDHALAGGGARLARDARRGRHEGAAARRRRWRAARVGARRVRRRVAAGPLRAHAPPGAAAVAAADREDAERRAVAVRRGRARGLRRVAPGSADAARAALLEEADALLATVRAFHEEVRGSCGPLLEASRRQGRPELAARPGLWGAGDLGYALDEAVEGARERFVRRLGDERPATVIAEGPGEQRFAPRSPDRARTAVRVIVDPVDGTRAMMH